MSDIELPDLTSLTKAFSACKVTLDGFAESVRAAIEPISEVFGVRPLPYDKEHPDTLRFEVECSPIKAADYIDLRCAVSHPCGYDEEPSKTPEFGFDRPDLTY